MHLLTRVRERVSGVTSDFDVPADKDPAAWAEWVWENETFIRYTELKEEVEQRLRDLDDTKGDEAKRLFTLKLYLEYRAYRECDLVI